jgi:hypothetical protein
MMFDAHALPGWMFASAWGTAALYAVGAAVTTFSAESEDRTRDFLQQLPGRWEPLFVGKLTLAIASSLALAGLLCGSGWLIAGGQWPSTSNVQSILAIGGVALWEATAWGLFFSLWLRQPLLAAVAAIGAASVGVQLSIAMTSQSHQAFTAGAYQAAVPTRLLLIAIVFATDVWLAARWLQPHSGRWRSKKIGLDTDTIVTDTPGASSALGKLVTSSGKGRRRMIGRLLWQTWRESWKTMLAIIPLALLLMVGMGLPTIVMQNATPSFDLPIFQLGILFLPALFGALVFRADQRGTHREFLATHAGRPRYLWLVRQAVWLTGLLIVGIVIQVAIGLTFAMVFQNSLRHFVRYGSGYLFGEYRHNLSGPNWQLAGDTIQAVKIVVQATLTGWISLLTAFGIGQFCSLLLRREVLAGFLALLLSMVLAAWVLTVGFWQLSPWWFVLPLGVCTMLASWIRIPDWLVGRTPIRAWLLPLAAVATPLIGFALLLPGARLAQLDNLSPEYPYFGVSLSKTVDQFEVQDNQARETADAYIRLSMAIVSQDKAAYGVTVDGKSWDDLPSGGSPGGEGAMSGEGAGGYGGLGGALRVDPWTPKQRELSKKLAAKEQQIYVEANRQVIDKLIELSQRPLCHFPESVIPKGGLLYRQMEELKDLLLTDAGQLQAEGNLDAALDRYLALLRIKSHELRGQPISLVNQKLRETRFPGAIEKTIVESWATHAAQTSKRLRAAIARLEKCPATVAASQDSILDDRQRIRAVVLGNEPPSFLPWSGHLAFLANKLPWERQRALLALDMKTSQTLNYLTGAMHRMSNPSIHYAEELRQLVRQAPWRGAPEPNQVLYGHITGWGWEKFAHAAESSFHASTSYLVTQELNDRFFFGKFLSRYVQSEIDHRGLKLQLALLAYRLDHDEYPKTLAELAPEQIEKLPLDPYSGEAFQYRPHGFDLPLAARGHVPAHTPLFWSVGCGNRALSQETAAPVSHGNAFQVEESNEAETQQVILLQSTEWSQYDDWPLVFRLPR